MVRQCHSNTCPVGVCVQDPRLREKFTGTPEKVINLMTFIAEDVREILAELGVETLDEIIGRTDMLAQVSRGAENLDDLDLNPILARADSSSVKDTRRERTPVPDTLDINIIADARQLFDRGEKTHLTYAVQNTHRAVGTRTSSHIYQSFGAGGLPDGQLTVRLRGSAGQSLGAFGMQGLRLIVDGDANDYVGKGLSGAEIIVSPQGSTPIEHHSSAIIGNTCLYGATKGSLMDPDSVVWQRFDAEHYEEECKDLIRKHAAQTGSEFSKKLLAEWELERGKFWQIIPKEMLSRLDVPLTQAAAE